MFRWGTCLLILFACKGKRKLATRSSRDVWSVPRIGRAAYPTQKPVGVFERMLADDGYLGPGYAVPLAGDRYTSRGSSIAGGSAEVQAMITAKRVLGL